MEKSPGRLESWYRRILKFLRSQIVDAMSTMNNNMHFLDTIDR